MAGALDVNIITFNLSDTASDWQANDVNGHIFKAPSQAQGGAVRITRAWAVNQGATGAGTGFALTLLNYGAAGTVNSGTVAAALGGTGDPWAAGVPKQFTLSDPVLDADEWLVLKKTETNSSDPSRCTVIIEYVMGK